MPHFYPNSSFHEELKHLFTGRTSDLDKIINNIVSGQCVALYGERRIGKTFTLVMLADIINGHITAYKQNLKDQTFVNAIDGWKTQLTNHYAVYISLLGTRSENDLLNNFSSSTKEIVPNFPTIKSCNRLSKFLDYFQNWLLHNNKYAVFLLDEMETLADYENQQGKAVAELFCDRQKYTKIIFIHTGSYKWKERVDVSGSSFRHLASIYIKSINLNDMENYLLKPLQENEKKKFVSVMSGGKPLYAQYIAQTVYEKNSLDIEIFL